MHIRRIFRVPTYKGLATPNITVKSARNSERGMASKENRQQRFVLILSFNTLLKDDINI